MILSCLPVSYFPAMLRGEMSVEGFAAEARALGLQAIDLSILLLEGRGPRGLSALRRAVESENLFVNMVTCYPDYTHPEGAERERQAEQARGLRPVFENHARPGVWERFDFCYPTDLFLAVVRATEGSGLGVNFDTANTLAYGDDPLPVLCSVRHRLACIHAAETRARGRFEPAVLGEGAVPFGALFRYLRESGYDGPVSIEEAGGRGPEGLRIAVELVRRLWNEEDLHE
jgi:sugar phosphate isomerase/epimerase